MRKTSFATAVTTAVIAGCLALPVAGAIPPGGASKNFPGAKITFEGAESPVVPQCGSVKVKIAGMGQYDTVLSVKIDNGAFLTDPEVGSLGNSNSGKNDVIALVPVVKGAGEATIWIPCNVALAGQSYVNQSNGQTEVATGKHTLRFIGNNCQETGGQLQLLNTSYGTTEFSVVAADEKTRAANVAARTAALKEDLAKVANHPKPATVAECQAQQQATPQPAAPAAPKKTAAGSSLFGSS